MPLTRHDDIKYTLASALSGASASGSAVAIRGGEYIFACEAAGNTGAMGLQIQAADTGTWIDLQVFSGSFVRTTGNSMCQTSIDLPPGNVRFACVGGTLTTGYATLTGLG